MHRLTETIKKGKSERQDEERYYLRGTLLNAFLQAGVHCEEALASREAEL